MQDNKKLTVKKIICLAIAAAAMVAVMVAIFLFSGQDGKTSTTVSTGVADTVVDIMDIEVPKGETSSTVPIVAGLNIRKCAHLFLYMMLGLTSFAFFTSLFWLVTRPFKLKLPCVSLCALLLCFGYACLDEYHQSFIDGRTSKFSDVGIDAIGFGILISICIVAWLIVSLIIRKRAKGNNS